MLKFCFSVLLMTVILRTSAQRAKDSSLEISASLNSYFSSGEDLPFWITSNQNGIFSEPNNSFQLLQVGFSKPLTPYSLKKAEFFYGTNLTYSLSAKKDFQFNQYWVGSRYKWLILKVGAQADPVLYNGLSSTNANMDWSNNARPLPGVSLATDGFIPFFFWKKWFSFKAFYSENLLLDTRYVEKSHLHHKSLIGKVSLNHLNFSLGLDHWVYWGGISGEFGEMPGFTNYLQYIVGLKGGANSPQNEKGNVLGNSLGVYLFKIEKELPNSTLSFYYNHPFEDRSGLEMDNLPDGLWGLFYHLKDKKILSGFLYEFQNTTNQSGTYNMVQVGDRLTGRGNDNYFNNFIYRSGHVHYNHMMGSPFFIPVINENGISMGFDNTRMIVHHLGLNGWLGGKISWKSLLSWSRSFGTYDPGGMFPTPLDQFSWLAEGKYYCKSLPVRINMGLAGDYGQRFQQRIGGYAGISLVLDK